MTRIAWPRARGRHLLTKGLLLLVAGQLVGGGIYSLVFLLDSTPLAPSGKIPLAVVAAGGIILLAVAAWWAGRMQRTKSLASYLGEISICWKNKTTTLSALLDSGNTLRHPVNSWPVVIVEGSAVAGLLGQDVLDWLEAPLRLPPAAIDNRIALIPYTSLGKKGILAAVKPDEVVIRGPEGSITLTQVYVAVRPKKQAPLEYQALAFPIGIKKEGGSNCEECG